MGPRAGSVGELGVSLDAVGAFPRLTCCLRHHRVVFSRLSYLGSREQTHFRGLRGPIHTLHARRLRFTPPVTASGRKTRFGPLAGNHPGGTSTCKRTPACPFVKRAISGFAPDAEHYNPEDVSTRPKWQYFWGHKQLYRHDIVDFLAGPRQRCARAQHAAAVAFQRAGGAR